MNHVYDTCVGLGYHCESTYQIRRFTGIERAAFFDWLDLELPSVVTALTTGFQGVLRPGLSVPDSDGACVHDKGSGIRFFHDFHAPEGQPLTTALIDEQLPAVRAKFAYLADRWRTTASSTARVLYVHHDAFDEASAADVRRLHATLAAQHAEHRFGLLWLRRTPPSDAHGLPPGVSWDTVPLVEGRWEGDDASWDRVLTRFPLAAHAHTPN
ncbi:papain-like cysteine peptidase [Streptomyces sp. NPDC050504]|uniref:papain-like cysteine peptidase n=1 Tax=Streptomyces sp. NPDC050504 TaxID=3365618 RepID=UPI0037A97954